MHEKHNSNDFYEVFEVFSRRTFKSDMLHQFSLLAPNQEMAFVMAQENFMRREPVVDIWVVKRSDIRKASAEEKNSFSRIDNKDYRLTKGYGYLKKKWRQYEQQILDEKEIMSWGGDQRGSAERK
ncbi:1,2-phenylacetyl-CoA epoxidase subunit PaaB [Heyndrickxia sp. NPDC080065]|uniref:1,2-phenylacetyl-CoA epoxidase subunit PaaB n=1 Tax=Heyndrickxia sp. NPDC080065 TaxID=3390568 RepID=UPI003D0927EB